MNRINLTNGSGRWFNSTAVEHYEKDTYFDGRNHISIATGSRWEHEDLYHTAGGRWILSRRSQWQGSGVSIKEVSEDRAARWLVRNGHPDVLPLATAALEV